VHWRSQGARTPVCSFRAGERGLGILPNRATERIEEPVMNNQNFTTTFSVDQTPEEVFDAINNVRGWWSGEIEGSTDKLGDEFTYRYQDVHYSKQKIIEVIPNKKVTWLVLDNHLNFIKDKNEWKGTKIIFEISKKGGKTEIRFTHLGLVPEYECFDICSTAWGSYINGSLRSLITAGKGQPNQKEIGNGERLLND
jgi:hypothetical protein